MSLHVLTSALLDLADGVPDHPRPWTIGGGFGLYVKQRDLEQGEPVETLLPGEVWPSARTTEDIDLILATEVIVSEARMRSLRDALDRLGYVPRAEHFQFEKEVPLGLVKIDLLAGVVPSDQLDCVKIKPPRIRAKNYALLHAYLNREAVGLGIADFRTILRGTRSDGTPAELPVCVPNSFTYFVMKLHAFNDRVEDPGRGLAKHHALDLYRIAAMLTHDEYESTRMLSHRFASEDVVREAGEIVKRFFCGEATVGLLRLRAAAEESGLSAERLRVSQFSSLLEELFTASRSI